MDELAPELLCAIFLLTEVRTVVRCRQVSKGVKAVVDETPVLQYRLALWMHGMHDTVASDNELSFPARLDKLSQYCDNREACRWGYTTALRAQNNGKWDYSQGIFISYDAQAECFNARQLPVELRGISERTWTVEFKFDGSLRMVDFEIDPSQNVIVNLMCPVELAQQPEGVRLTVHPIALELPGTPETFRPFEAIPRLLDPVSASAAQGPGILYGMKDDVMGFAPRGDSDLRSYIVFNWKTGQTHDAANPHAPQILTRYPTSDNFSLLSTSQLAYTAYEEDGSGVSRPLLVVQDVRSNKRVLFELPHVRNPEHFNMRLHTEKVSSDIARRSLGTWTTDRECPEHHLLAISHRFEREEAKDENDPEPKDFQRSHSIVIFVKLSTIFSHLVQMPDAQSPSDETFLQWKHWGRNNPGVLLTYDYHISIFPLCINGMRVIVQKRDRKGRFLATHILDFNPRTLHRVADGPDSPHEFKLNTPKFSPLFYGPACTWMRCRVINVPPPPSWPQNVHPSMNPGENASGDGDGGDDAPESDNEYDSDDSDDSDDTDHLELSQQYMLHEDGIAKLRLDGEDGDNDSDFDFFDVCCV